MSDSFIKFDKIDGEVGDADKSLAGAIHLTGWNWGADHHTATGRTVSRGHPGQVRQFVFHYSFDAAAVNFMQRCVLGQMVPQALLTMRRAGGGEQQTFLTIKFSDVLFLDVDFEQSPSHEIPLVKVRMTFQKVELRYNEQSATGINKTGAQTFVHSHGPW